VGRRRKRSRKREGHRHNWKSVNKNDFANDEQTAKADRIIELIDQLVRQLDEDF